MGKLRSFSGKEICSLLEKTGFSFIRQRGSHAIMQKKVKNTTITVPVPIHQEIRPGTLQSIIRQSKLQRGLFEVKNR